MYAFTPSLAAVYLNLRTLYSALISARRIGVCLFPIPTISLNSPV